MRITLIATLCVICTPCIARDDGRYANSDPKIKEWFQHLQSRKGLCCSDADGNAVQDADWIATKEGHYRVFVENKWVEVEDTAVITEPNKYGKTMVWLYHSGGEPIVRCFMPGSMI